MNNLTQKLKKQVDEDNHSYVEAIANYSPSYKAKAHTIKSRRLGSVDYSQW